MKKGGAMKVSELTRLAKNSKGDFIVREFFNGLRIKEALIEDFQTIRSQVSDEKRV